MDKNKVLFSVLALIILVAGIFCFMFWRKSAEQEKARIDAQNEVARLSAVVMEKENAWSRLSQQRDDLEQQLRRSNVELSEIIDQRDEAIVSLTQAFASFRSIRVVVSPANVSQNTENGRTRVSFEETVDPIRVSGFTLTNPAEADVSVEFVRPLRLTTAITQQEDGSWRTYIESDWPNVSIENIETSVNPLARRDPGFMSRFLVNVSTSVSPKFSGATASVGFMYGITDSFYLGPFVEGVVSGDSFVSVGAMASWRVFGNE
jgi:hypothetical protein